MSKTKSLHHIVFATKYREQTISESHKKELYAYIYGIIKSKKCFLHRINGIADHIHILVDIHPSISLSDFVKCIKQSSSNWLKRQPNFSRFKGWGEGYYSSSLSVENIAACKLYIINQECHHVNLDLASEMMQFATENGLDFHINDLD